MQHLLMILALTVTPNLAGTSPDEPLPLAGTLPDEPPAEATAAESAPLAPRLEDPDAPPLWVPAWDLYFGDAQELATEVVLDGGIGSEPQGRLPMEAGARLVGTFAAARGLLQVEQAEVRFFKLQGARMALVNGTPVYGDPERRGWEGFPVALQAGTNEIWVLQPDGGFELELWKPAKPVVLGTWAPELVLGGEHFVEGWNTLWVPIFNASLDPVESLCFHYGRAVAAEYGESEVTEWACGSRLSALGMTTGRANVDEMGGVERPGASRMMLVPLAAGDAGSEERDERWLPFLYDGPFPGLGGGEATFGRGPRAEDPRAKELARWLKWSYRVTGDPLIDRTTLEVARFCQQEAWYHRGWHIELFPDPTDRTGLSDRHMAAVSRANASFSIGCGEQNPEQDQLVVDARSRGEGDELMRELSVRGTSVRGLKRALLRAPMLEEPGAGGEPVDAADPTETDGAR